MKVNGQLHVCSALPLVPIGCVAGWIIEPVLTLYRREHLLPLTGIEPRPTNQYLYRLSYSDSYLTRNMTINYIETAYRESYGPYQITI
jgi:hypothetical protein